MLFWVQISLFFRNFASPINHFRYINSYLRVFFNKFPILPANLLQARRFQSQWAAKCNVHRLDVWVAKCRP